MGMVLRQRENGMEQKTPQRIGIQIVNDMQILNDYNINGLIIGLVTFFIICLFHPLVIKGEYYFGVKCWWAFLFAGIIGVVLSLNSEDTTVSTIWGVFSFSCFWSIKEVFDQKKRVEKGWFPKRNPKKENQAD